MSDIYIEIQRSVIIDNTYSCKTMLHAMVGNMKDKHDTWQLTLKNEGFGVVFVGGGTTVADVVVG